MRRRRCLGHFLLLLLLPLPLALPFVSATRLGTTLGKAVHPRRRPGGTKTTRWTARTHGFIHGWRETLPTDKPTTRHPSRPSGLPLRVLPAWPVVGAGYVQAPSSWLHPIDFPRASNLPEAEYGSRWRGLVVLCDALRQCSRATEKSKSSPSALGQKRCSSHHLQVGIACPVGVSQVRGPARQGPPGPDWPLPPDSSRLARLPVCMGRACSRPVCGPCWAHGWPLALGAGAIGSQLRVPLVHCMAARALGPLVRLPSRTARRSHGPPDNPCLSRSRPRMGRMPAKARAGTACAYDCGRASSRPLVGPPFHGTGPFLFPFSSPLPPARCPLGGAMGTRRRLRCDAAMSQRAPDGMRIDIIHHLSAAMLSPSETCQIGRVSAPGRAVGFLPARYRHQSFHASFRWHLCRYGRVLGVLGLRLARGCRAQVARQDACPPGSSLLHQHPPPARVDQHFTHLGAAAPNLIRSP